MIRRVLVFAAILAALLVQSSVQPASACPVIGSCSTPTPTPTPTPTQQAASSSSSSSSQQVDTVSMEQQFFDLVNHERTSRGMSALSYNSKLTQYARSHSNDMESQGQLYHNQSELESQQFADDMGHPTMIGENVGEGPSVDWIHNAFMNSSEHRSNILEPRYTSIGIGVSYSSKDSTIWVTEDFIRGGSTVTRPSFPYHSEIVGPAPIGQGPGVVKQFRFMTDPNAIASAAAALVIEIARMHLPPAISVLRLPPIPAFGSDGGVPLHKARPLLPLAVLATLSAVAFASRRDAGAYI
ncbi:MAG: CAP domain-containing protein [Actinomycetota bacterium]